MRAFRVILVTAVCLGGCKLNRPAPAKVDDPENQALLAKLQPYIRCLEEHSEAILRTADLVRARSSVRSLPDPRSCATEIAIAQLQPPGLPELEVAAAGFVTSLKKATTLTAAMSPAPKEQLLVALEELELAQSALFDNVYQINRQVHLDQLARKEKVNGRTLVVRADTVTVHAEELVRITSTTADRLDVLDLPTIAKQLQVLESLVEDLAVYALSEPKQVTAWGNGYHGLEEAARELVIEVKQLLHRAEQKLPYTDAEQLMIDARNEADVVGTPAAVVAAYNRLVDFYGVR